MDQKELDTVAKIIESKLDEDFIVHCTLTDLIYIMSIVGPAFGENIDKKIELRVKK